MRTNEYFPWSEYLSLAMRVQLVGHRGGGRGDAARKRLVVDARESNVLEFRALCVDNAYEAERALEENSVQQTCRAERTLTRRLRPRV